ncbi:FeoA family protein [Tropicimonas sediminicola]|uniref:Ferrous iron transport protein A n=1 Tax=Tropicimonas sediminicola TaxID=1031541 RepID=A0A239IA22_9RHOB|nr:FeoA family protein [Tropicimonas sediminicola]SNS90389.1 ferrous iron transport protein A [Tropicimonas sediminicola]
MRYAIFDKIGLRRGKPRGTGCGKGRRRCCAGATGECRCGLDAMEPGERCTIRRLCGCGPVRQRLLDLGFQPGREVRMVRNAPLLDPIELQLDDSFIVLRRREAAQIQVRHD